MRAHLVQFDIAWEDKNANYERVRSLVASASIQPGEMIVLPEMFDTGFSLKVEKTADHEGETQSFLVQLARRRSVYVWGGFTIRRADGMGLNRAIVAAPDGSITCQYDKMHPFSFGRESERFVGGGEVVTGRWAAGEESLMICPAICYDLRFPELFRRGLSLGAELFVVGANWPAERAAHWRALLVARAIENQAFVIGVNRVGADPHLSYNGGSLVVSPLGEILVDAGQDECVTSVTIDAGAVSDWRRIFPAWRDKRSDL